MSRPTMVPNVQASDQTLSATFSLRVVAAASGMPDSPILVSGPLVIGRDASCEIVLNESSISRRHARVEPAPDGVRVIDLGSGNGVWVGSEAVVDQVLGPGQQFRIGSTVFECAVSVAAAHEAESTRVRITVEIIEGVPGVPAGREYTIDGDRVTIGRGDECDITLTSPDVSRHHAQLHLTSSGIRLNDLRSRYGTWLGARQVASELIEPDQPFRVGAQIVLRARADGDVADTDATRFVSIGSAQELRSGAAMPPDVDDADFRQTIVMPVPARAAEPTWRIEDEGEMVPVSAHAPFLLDDPESAWYVVSGGILIFTVALEKGEPVGTRAHFLGIVPGQMLMGFDLRRYDVGSGFLAVARQGTVLCKMTRDRLRRLAANRRETIAALIDTWIGGLSAALVTDVPATRTDDLALRPDERVSLDLNRTATAGAGVVWVRLWSGSVLFDDMTAPRFTLRDAMFPLTPHSWIRPVSDEFGPVSLQPVSTASAIGSADLWAGLDVFHQVLCECEFINKKVALADEFVRLQQKAQQVVGAQQAALDAIGSVMSSERSTAEEFRARGDAEPTLRACQLVGDALGIPVRPHPVAQEALTYEERVSSIAVASGVRTRVVALRDQWYREDNGPLLGQVADTKEPVALLPAGARAYSAVNPQSGARRAVDEKLAETLSGFAYTFYRPFAEGALRVGDVVRWGARGVRSDLLWVFYMSLIVGVFGTITPFITGQVFDSAIPQAQRTALIGFGVALVVAALAAAVFKFVQGVATVRIQTRMSSAIQAAVWDRILNLPTSFFRQYSAGDLADRAQGVDAIQRLVSGAGVAAILGSVSGLFYIAQMFSFNLRLAFLAILLTVVYVSVNMGANYLQLRYQRLELRIRGRITGLVLNLLTGVTKLRVCGAEHHAFRIWAEQFAEQRRISFTVGTIQNVATVFTAIYPVISSIAIFATMISLQQSAGGMAVMTTGEFIAFNSAYGLFLMAMQALGDASLNLLRVVPIYERLAPILTTLPEIDASKAFPGTLTGRIELSHVSFRYSSDGPWIINDVSLVIEPGEFVAFVGSSGGGKSTLLRLMLGFEQPTRGSVLYDGQDLNSLDMRMVRQQLGVVLQASRVMPTEIFRNIVGVTSRTIEDAWAAAEKAGLAEDIRNMPMGMHTYVSEGGGTLSGGQRQRLMIARAIVNRPRILFLDEATSALDNRAQATVTESMDRMDATRIVIAHRLSTVINAHRICYLHAGSIAEIGSYQELMDKDGLFAQLARRQVV